jgi:hypothetical protein
MSKPRKQKIKAASDKTNPVTNAKDIIKVGDNLKEDSDPAVSAIGVLVTDSAGKLSDSVLDNDNAHDAAQLANTKMYEQNTETCTVYNDAAGKIMLKFPNDPDKWKGYGFVLTKDKAEDKPIPDQPVNCSMEQGEFYKTCKVRFDLPANAETYTIEMTKTDPKDDASYVIVKDPKVIFTTTTIIFNVPNDFLNVNLWLKVTAHNANGCGPASEPFGGRRIQ